MRTTLLTAALLSSLLLSGCSSMFSDDKYAIKVSSDPSGANYVVKNEAGKEVKDGVTPDTIVLPSHAGAFDGEKYTFTFSKDGFQPKTVVLDSGMNSWFPANILLGGVIGMTVDMSTGAAYDLPDAATAKLEAIPQPVSAPMPVAQQAAAQPPALTKEQQLDELSKKPMSYDQYQQEYRRIMGQ